ncbi:DNA-binding LytR/AlgR family response regulator [Pedobacter cryoconitis]|uniref:DNA-binding LytR/AlgR family response regulator n=1 Tax=Pedobacter cryoconitis TaxID=188932 RepID=A0A7W8ZJY1_9SPHI|nr:LytTR family DNA-binding domain-containing protein [Pedobacter cryoconitis]MBB5635158.1 DNA-binding LytR/AlgR family response regulator [Pedobacter cryoconitis]MBB6271658.1 DNA-binding LytR/AlgR family response regulator [Pedobacter cryoconitis]
MEIIIIEDEIKAARSLANLIVKIRPAVKITAQLQSIESAVGYFSENKQPDLIFMDIQLSDGLCFEIFKTVSIQCPVVFCTAYGEYSMDAIKANGIDYLLKPFSKEELETAFEKVENFKNFFQENTRPDLEQLLKRIGIDEGKKSFLVFKHNKYTTIQTDSIAFIYIRNESATIMTFQGQEYTLSQSLDQVQSLLSSKQFFRLNRQYLINFSAIKDVEHYFDRKLFVQLVIPSPDKLLIGKEKTTGFLSWLENR